MLVDESELRHGHPITARQVHSMLSHAASVDERGTVAVKTAAGATLRSDDPSFSEALAQLVGRPASLHEDTSGANHDDSDVLVINLASVRALTEEYGSERDPMRFRPSIMLDGPDAQPYSELAWPGKRFKIGDLELEAVKMNERCVLTTIDPQTYEEDPGFLRFMVQQHEGNFGVYCRVATGGTVREGDLWQPL